MYVCMYVQLYDCAYHSNIQIVCSTVYSNTHTNSSKAQQDLCICSYARIKISFQAQMPAILLAY